MYTDVLYLSFVSCCCFSGSVTKTTTGVAYSNGSNKLFLNKIFISIE